MIDYLASVRQYILTVHLLGVVLGFGGAIFTDIIFARCLHKRSISDDELNIMKLLSHLIWVGLIILASSGALLFHSNVDSYINSDAFLAKMTLVFILLLNGVFLNVYVTPSIKKVFDPLLEDKGFSIRKIAFASGAISISSWFFIFFLSMLKKVIVLSFVQYLSIYLFIVISSIIVSQISEFTFSQKLKSDTQNP